MVSCLPGSSVRWSDCKCIWREVQEFAQLLHAPEADSCAQELDEYRSLGDDLVESSKRWMEWMTLERPEDEPLPGNTIPFLSYISFVHLLHYLAVM